MIAFQYLFPKKKLGSFDHSNFLETIRFALNVPHLELNVNNRIMIAIIFSQTKYITKVPLQRSDIKCE